MSEKKTLIRTVKKQESIKITHAGEEMEITYLRNVGTRQVSLMLSAPESFKFIRSLTSEPKLKDDSGTK